MKSSTVLAASALLAAPAGNIAASVDADTRSPVEKVVQLLKGLRNRIHDDLEKDTELYDKYACWCGATAERKATDITKAKADLTTLGQEILMQKGIVGTRTSELGGVMDSIKTNEEEQQTETTVRQKEHQAYQAEAADMKQTVMSLEKAMDMLGPATLLQLRSRESLRAEVVKHVESALTSMPLRAAARLPAKKVALLRHLTAAFSGSKAKDGFDPQSASIVGILQEIQKTLSADLEQSTTDEKTKQDNFEALMAVKHEALVLLQEDVATKESEKSEAEMLLAEATLTYDETEKQMNADIEFFDLTKEGCLATNTEWVARKQAHQDEITAISNGLDILTSDAAREIFGTKSFGVFLQVASAQKHNEVVEAAPTKVTKAYEVLRKQARSTHSVKLARLAAKVRLATSGRFDDVISAIDTMLTTIKTEAQSDGAKKDECKTEYQNIAGTSADLEWKIKNNQAEIDKLAGLIAASEEEKAETEDNIAEVERQMGEMNATRASENQAFLDAKQGDEDAIGLLNNTKDALAAWYERSGAELVQKGRQGPEFAVSQDQAPDATFTKDGKRDGEAKGIVDLIGLLVEDLQIEIATAIQVEAESVAEYDKQIEAAQALKTTLGEKKTELEGFIADRGSDKLTEETTMSDNKGLLRDEQDYKANISPDCDWIINSFMKRHEARTAEMEALTQAKEFLSGAAVA